MKGAIIGVTQFGASAPGHIVETAKAVKDDSAAMVPPSHNDVVVRLKSGNPSVCYVLGTGASPDQFSFRGHADAVRHAVGYARHAQVRAWFLSGDDHLVLLGSFSPDKESEPAR